jgi:hypothetical protein
MQVTSLGERDQLFNKWAHLFSFLHGGDDSAVFEERPRQVSFQGQTMSCVSAEFSAGL